MQKVASNIDHKEDHAIDIQHSLSRAFALPRILNEAHTTVKKRTTSSSNARSLKQINHILQKILHGLFAKKWSG
ncbi:hypothetical protein SUGI_0245290 [Cryptomeria japonica]|nr:hypothetical protein SUGI_0245290 [Cryptomeria japonica]